MGLGIAELLQKRKVAMENLPSSSSGQ